MILGAESKDLPLGAVTLHPHQRSAVDRLEAALDRFNGALLCDEVGMGKTYVAIAVARKFERRLIVTPAALTSMWAAALRTAATTAESVTFETLSRRDSQLPGPGSSAPVPYDLVIVDEAHHVRNPRTNRYFALENIVRGAKVLLLSATPIHNRRDDLVALLALFLGSRARGLTAAELALCVVRREQKRLGTSIQFPTLRPSIYHQLPDDPSLVEHLLALPSPIPVRDGGLGGALIGRGLVHQWASSEAALGEAIKRRLARAAALSASLESGTYPTARELETWIYGEGALQLGFAALLAAPFVGHRDLLASVRIHLDALREIRARSRSATDIDAERAALVGALRNSHVGSRIVAFAQYAETVSMLFHRLAPSGKVAMLTSHGARVAGGSLTRREAIDRFAPQASGARQPRRAERVDLLLTTDLLSEGVNLQDADVLIHLDIPWTVARMEQRVGRLARLGSRHQQVTVHVLQPPGSAERVLRSQIIVEQKRRVANIEVGISSRPLRGVGDFVRELPEIASTPKKAERLRAILETWIDSESANPGSDEGLSSQATIVATADADRAGFVAAVCIHDAPQLLVNTSSGIQSDLATQIEACANTGQRDVPTDLSDCVTASDSIAEWIAHENASIAAGLGASAASHRREVIGRIDAAIESAPPHLRTARLVIAARARRIAAMPQCAAVERELDRLLRSDLPPGDWLTAVAALETKAGSEKQSSPSPPRIHAVLILRTRS